MPTKKRAARPLQDQVALITGAGTGIGRSIALHLASRGVAIVVTGRNERRLGEVVGEITNGGGKARHLAGDVRDPKHLEAAVQKAIDTWKRLDIVVANAGQSGAVPMGTGDLALARDILDTNLTGAYYTFHAALAKMAGPGRLIAISSCLGKFGVPGYAAYCASKAGLIGMVRALAQELGAREITANAICPGWVDTEMAQRGFAGIAAAHSTTIAEAEAGEMAAFPLGRMVDPDEVAEMVMYLASSAADAITGQALSICGGSTT